MGQKVESQESPLTRQHREYTLGSWRTMINLFRPDLGEGKHWHVATVRYFAPMFLRFWVSHFFVLYPWFNSFHS